MPKQVTIFSKVLGVKAKGLKSSLSILLFLLRQIIWERCIYYLKFTKTFWCSWLTSYVELWLAYSKRFRVLDSHLKGTMQETWSYIKASNDFINKTKNLNALSVTGGAVGLYPSIPHEAGLKALKEALKEVLSTNDLIRVAESVLKNN